MTREEAKREILFAKREVMADSWIDKAYDVAIEALEQPERKKGKWEQIKGRDGYIDFRCSACRKYRFHNGAMRKEYKFCPNCGADMREE